MTPQMFAAAAEKVTKVVEGFGTWQMSRAKASALRAQARATRGEASMDAQLRADEGERAAATAAVMGAASGGGFDGSFGASLEQLERNARFNVRSAIWAGETEARNLEYEAKLAKWQGNMALFTSIIGAGGSLAGDMMGQAERRKQEAAKANLYRRGYGR